MRKTWGSGFLHSLRHVHETERHRLMKASTGFRKGACGYSRWQPYLQHSHAARPVPTTARAVGCYVLCVTIDSLRCQGAGSHVTSTSTKPVSTSAASSATKSSVKIVPSAATYGVVIALPSCPSQITQRLSQRRLRLESFVLATNVAQNRGRLARREARANTHRENVVVTWSPRAVDGGGVESIESG